MSTAKEPHGPSVGRACDPILLATLCIVREVLAHRTPDFVGRVQIIALVDSAIRFGQLGPP